jgi:NADH-quinone oxidoreductase subunit A
LSAPVTRPGHPQGRPPTAPDVPDAFCAPNAKAAMDQVIAIVLVFGLGLVFVAANLTIGRFVRPNSPNPEKQAIYECGETPIGTSWVQFDLRFYIVALFFLIFDVEVALIYPWAVVFRENPGVMLALGLPFLLVVIAGYAYEWHCGSLDWVRSSINTSLGRAGRGSGEMRRPDYAAQARRDPEGWAEEPGDAPGDAA